MATTRTDRLGEETYRRLALADPGGQLELYQEELREKPGMSVEHGAIMVNLVRQLPGQLDESEYRLRITYARLRRSADTYFVPDITVVPAMLGRALRERPGSLDAYPEPLPLMAEMWSPSTGRYNINDKVSANQARGDLKIWRVLPYERIVAV